MAMSPARRPEQDMSQAIQRIQPVTANSAMERKTRANPSPKARAAKWAIHWCKRRMVEIGQVHRPRDRERIALVDPRPEGDGKSESRREKARKCGDRATVHIAQSVATACPAAGSARHLIGDCATTPGTNLSNAAQETTKDCVFDQVPFLAPSITIIRPAFDRVAKLSAAAVSTT